ncbi:MAG: hypothetical protein ACPGYX_09570 [Oceanobacter sp.]
MFRSSVAIVLLGCALVAQVQAGLFGRDCTPSEGVQPSWVTSTASLADQHLNTYAVGVAAYQSDVQQQKAEALRHAQSVLAESILVHVKSSFEQVTTVEGDAVSASGKSTKVSESNLKIPGVSHRADWLDQECQLHTLISVPKQTETLIVKRRLLNELEQTAKQSERPLPIRQRAIDQALALTAEFEFGELSNSLNSQQLRRQLCPLQKRLSNQLGRQTWGLAMLSNADMAEAELFAHGEQLQNGLARQFHGLAYVGSCATRNQCLEQAAELGIGNLILGLTEFEVSHSMGTYHGQYRLQLQALGAGSQGVSAKLAPAQAANVLHHKRKRVTAEVGLQNWMKKFAPQLEGFHQDASSGALGRGVASRSLLCTGQI